MTGTFPYFKEDRRNEVEDNGKKDALVNNDNGIWTYFTSNKQSTLFLYTTCTINDDNNNNVIRLTSFSKTLDDFFFFFLAYGFLLDDKRFFPQ